MRARGVRPRDKDDDDTGRAPSSIFFTVTDMLATRFDTANSCSSLDTSVTFCSVVVVESGDAAADDAALALLLVLLDADMCVCVCVCVRRRQYAVMMVVRCSVGVLSAVE